MAVDPKGTANARVDAYPVRATPRSQRAAVASKKRHGGMLKLAREHTQIDANRRTLACTHAHTCLLQQRAVVGHSHWPRRVTQGSKGASHLRRRHTAAAVTTREMTSLAALPTGTARRQWLGGRDGGAPAAGGSGTNGPPT